VHDFALAAKFSSEEDSDLAEMKIQAEGAYNPPDFALYLPVWQGEKRREEFTQLCLELGCKLDEFQECSQNHTEDLWTIKANYIASVGDIVIVREKFSIPVDNNGKFKDIWQISDEDPINHGMNYRKIGIINSNCAIDQQLNYAGKYGFANIDNCEYIDARMKK